MPVLLRLDGSGPLGNVPPASFWICAIWAGVGVGNPSGSGNLNGTAATQERMVDRVANERCMMRGVSGMWR